MGVRAGEGCGGEVVYMGMNLCGRARVGGNGCVLVRKRVGK